MEFTVIGRKKVDFIGDDGRKVMGVNLFGTSPIADEPGGEGERGFKEWVGADSSLYDKVCSIPHFPILCDLVYEFNPVSKKSRLKDIIF